MTRTRIAAAFAVLALAGCASGGGASPAAPTVAQVAAKIGATAVSLEASPTLYASHEGTATWHGQQVDIATFATGALRDKWEKIAREFGPILADGPGYAVTTG
jgi:ABC-type nitrate/sulfonate/bicarbonate transport system substrate-binding protein